MKFTTNQQIRIDIISQYLNGQIFAEDASAAIGIKERQFRRLVKKFREQGVISVLHGNINREPLNKLPVGCLNQIASLYKNKYKGFNLVHFIEKLHENEFVLVPDVPCYSTIRNFFIKEKLIQRTKKKITKIHRMRKRYEKEGIMVQIDGSPHRWIYGSSPFCLTAAIDDATGKLLGATFTRTETTFAAMDVVESIIKKYGRFQMLYSDKAGIYGGGKREGFSNMNRAMKELEIISLQANSPQAKGKVERLFKTLQDRLVSEISIRPINTIEEANKFLHEEFIDLFNKKFAVLAEDKVSAYRSLPDDIDLNEVFTNRVERTVKSGQIINYNSEQYVVTNQEYGSLIKKIIEIRHYRNGDMKMFLLSGQAVSYQILDKALKAA